jgi:hypothetical protein
MKERKKLKYIDPAVDQTGIQFGYYPAAAQNIN